MNYKIKNTKSYGFYLANVFNVLLVIDFLIILEVFCRSFVSQT